MSVATRVPILCLALALALAVGGCGGSAVVPVRGRVVFAGGALPEVCRLTFLPLDASDPDDSIRPGGAVMKEDGTYRMTPFQGVEGLLPGRYAVRVSYFELKPGGNPNREGDWIEHRYQADDLVVAAGSRAIEHDVEVH